ncbi:hypothetical protein [Corynebacterium mayonis]|uniref:hypothetical protein n=1 Tax=Corynebacterium mayonis TaxID=3062461 RepID=UPI0031408149
MDTATIVGIVSVVIGFALFGLAFWVTAKLRKISLAVGLGIAAFLFITVIPVSLAVFVAVPNPQ